MAWMRINDLGACLVTTMRALRGSRQYIFGGGSPSVFINSGYNMDFLVDFFCVTDNILQNNLVVILQSVEITAVLQFHAIMHISIDFPFYG